MITYKVNLTDYSQISKVIESINEELQSKDFKKFIVEKCEKELERIIQEKLIDSEYEIIKTYPQSNKTKIGDDYIELYNDSMVDLSQLSQKTLNNYPQGLSMAKLVEFGTGIVGASSEAANFAKNWEYDVNNHGNKGWYYEKDGMIYWSRGSEGKLIYHNLQLKIEENMSSWIEEYLKEKIGK